MADYMLLMFMIVTLLLGLLLYLGGALVDQSDRNTTVLTSPTAT